MPNYPRQLQAVLDAQEALRETERQAGELVASAREQFREALREAHAAGASFAELGRLVGLTRQRVARIIGG